MENEYEKRKRLKALRNGQLTAERSKDFWSENEREDVNRRYLSGEGISEMALALQRDEGAIVQQLTAMKLMTPPGKHRQRKPKPLRCQCPCAMERECKYYERGECKCCSNSTMRY